MKRLFPEKRVSVGAAAAALLLALFLLPGCTGGQGSSGSQSAQAGQGAASEAAHEPLTVCNINGLFSDEFIAAFQKEHPEVQFEVSAYMGPNGSGYALDTLNRGDIPEVFVSTYLFSPEAQREYLVDLSGYDFINSYSTTMLNDVDNEGGIYLLPSVFQMSGIFYNKTIMEEYGWAVPNSFEELKALVPEIEAAGLDPMRCMFTLEGYPFNYFFNIVNTEYFHTAEGAQWKRDFPNGEAQAAGNEKLLASAEYFKEWVDAGLINADDLTAAAQPKEAFLNGESVFFLCMRLSDYEVTTEEGETYEFAMMPWLSDDGASNTLTVMVSRYFGLSKELLEPGNEQKLEDALKLIEYVSTPEGQQALLADNATPSHYVSSLSGADVPEDSPFYELKDLLDGGHTIDLVYTGWEDLIVPLAQDIGQLIVGEISPEQMLADFDETYESVQRNSNILAHAEEDLSWDETLRLVGIATGRAVGADAALVSRGGYNEDHKVNDSGVNWYLYSGDITVETVNVFRTKCFSFSVLEMTGAQIKALADEGFDRYGDGSMFPYTLVTKGDVALEDDKVYRLAVGTEDLAKDLREQAVEVADINSRDAVVDYLSELGTFSADDIRWE